VTIRDLERRLGVAIFPDTYLNAPDAFDTYARECEGVDLVLIDALRGATPGEDENDSKIRYCLDNLTKVSERTGTAFVVIHHAGKDSGQDGRYRARGSSAIFDAAGNVYVLEGERDAPKMVSQEKGAAEAAGTGAEPFELEVEDVAAGLDKHRGLRIVYRLGEKKKRTPQELMRETAVAVLDFIRLTPHCSANQIRVALNLQHGAANAALDALLTAEKICNVAVPSKDRGARYLVVARP
jgi:hypothetical protein